jgi:hypothetical protein
MKWIKGASENMKWIKEASENMKWIRLNEKYSHKTCEVFGNKMKSSLELPRWIP